MVASIDSHLDQSGACDIGLSQLVREYEPTNVMVVFTYNWVFLSVGSFFLPCFVCSFRVDEGRTELRGSAVRFSRRGSDARYRAG